MSYSSAAAIDAMNATHSQRAGGRLQVPPLGRSAQRKGEPMPKWKASTRGKRPAPSPRLAAALDARRELQRALRAERQVSQLTRQLQRAIESADRGLLELAVRIGMRAVDEKRSEDVPRAVNE